MLVMIFVTIELAHGGGALGLSISRYTIHHGLQPTRRLLPKSSCFMPALVFCFWMVIIVSPI